MKKCPNCGTQLNDDALFCTECGNQIPQGNVCPHCGALVNDGDIFCQNCGKKIGEVPSSVPAELTRKTCPHCGAVVNDGYVFCENCGKKVVEECIHFTSNNIQKQSHAIKEGLSNKTKMIMPIVIGIIAVAIIGGGWWYWKQKAENNAADVVATTERGTLFTTQNVSFKKVSPTDNFDVKVEINVDFPVGDQNELNKSITTFILEALTENFVLDEDVKNPQYKGDTSNGQGIVDLYIKNVKLVQELLEK